MKYKYELIGGEIKVGDKVLHGVFYGVVKGFSKDHKLATVDFSNGANEPNLMNAARTPCALWRRDELTPDRPMSTNSREAPEVNKELWDGEFWTDVITCHNQRKRRQSRY